ncbi:MAG: hypothetical protein OXI27_00345 [Thaumarchaeota archaeon]|nr:hypothetical protein [Nitrososphaerota archaeon]MDE0525040.1 hypothetical protein [Nitrososphaerota archaeon]
MDARTGSASGAAAEPGDGADLVEEAVRRRRALCEDAWSADGKLRTEGYIRLKISVQLSGQRGRYGLVSGMFGAPRKSEAEMRASLDVSVQCLEEAAREHASTDKKKEAHVRLLIKYCMTFDWEYAIEACKKSLIGLCAEGGAWGAYAPRALQANIARYGARPPGGGVGTDPVTLCVDVLGQAGLDASRACAEYWRRNDAACAGLVSLLALSDRRHARRVAAVGLELFPRGVRVAAAALGALDPGDAGALRARCVLYAADPASEHYGAAKASAHWDAGWARRLADMLAARGELDAELEVLRDANLDGEALAALLHDGTARAAYAHRDLARAHPDRYYEICRRLAKGYAGECGEDARLDGEVLTCLRIMKGIPGRAAEFEGFCDELLRDPRTYEYLVGAVCSARAG